MSCRSGQSLNISKSKILLPLCFSLPSLKPASADTPSRFTPLPLPFLITIFCVFGSALSCLLSSSTYLSHTLRTGELEQWQLRQTPRLCGHLHSRKQQIKLLQHDSKIFKPCFIVPRTASLMLSGILSMRTQRTTPQTKKYGIIKVLPSLKYSACFLSSLPIFTSNGICSCSSKLSSSLLFIQASSDSFSSSLWHFSYPISSNACNIRSLSYSWRRLFL